MPPKVAAQAHHGARSEPEELTATRKPGFGGISRTGFGGSGCFAVVDTGSYGCSDINEWLKSYHRGIVHAGWPA